MKTEAKTAPKNKHGKAGVQHEKSRSQYCARSGLGGPGSSRLFKYDDSQPGAKEKAEEAAKTWVASQQE